MTITIADISMIGWVRVLNTFYAAADVLGLASYPKTMAWVERMMARPAVERGFNIPPRP